MIEDIYMQLRAKIESQQQIPLKHDKEALRRRAEIEVEIERQLQHLLFFRTHIFPAMPDYIRTVLMLQRKKLESHGIRDYIDITFPVEPGVETELGYPIPIQTEKSEQVKLYQVLLAANIPGKQNRYYVILCKADSTNATIEVWADVFDKLGRKVQILPCEMKPVDPFTEFKDGEFLVAIQILIAPAIENCLKNLLE